jgi:protein-L-isoaspartate(D-aspartate) O-methyltransferase
VTDVIADSARVAELRGRLAHEFVAEGTIMSNAVEAVLRALPRHLFAPGAPLEEVYTATAAGQPGWNSSPLAVASSSRCGCGA